MKLKIGMLDHTNNAFRSTVFQISVDVPLRSLLVKVLLKLKSKFLLVKVMLKLKFLLVKVQLKLK